MTTKTALENVLRGRSTPLRAKSVAGIVHGNYNTVRRMLSELASDTDSAVIREDRGLYSTF